MSLYHTGQLGAQWHYSKRQKPHRFTRVSFRTRSCSIKNEKQQQQKMGAYFHSPPLFQVSSAFLRGCQNYEDLEPDPAFAPSQQAARRLQRTSGSGQLHFVSVNNPVS